MKKLILFLFVIGVAFTSCKKDDIQEDTLVPVQTQNGFAINFTASWCGPCGDWGAPLIHDYAAEATNGAIICAHAGNGDPMNNPLYTSFSDDRTTGGGVPSFWVGNQKTTSASAMSTLLSTAAIAGVDYTYSISASTMTVETKTKFFSAGQGDYYLSVIVLEDGINGNSTAGSYAQNGTTNSYPNDDYHHDFVLRACATGNNAYGEMILQNPTANKEVDKTYTISLEPTWKNPYAVCIIWKYEAGSGAPEYKFVNSLKKKI